MSYTHVGDWKLDTSDVVFPDIFSLFLYYSEAFVSRSVLLSYSSGRL